MKIYDNRHNELSISEAIADKLIPNAYSYEGQLEKLDKKIELQSELIAKLVALIFKKVIVTAEEVENLLGYGYSVED